MMRFMALSGAFATLLASAHYGWLILKESVPRRPIGHLLALTAGAALGVYGAYVSNSWLAMGAGAVAVLVWATFIYILTLSPMPEGQLAVEIGGELLPFQAVTSDGRPFSSAELAGRRILLKFFRGHW